MLRKCGGFSIAELEAKREMKGMWADAGLKGRTPPRDHYLVQQFESWQLHLIELE